MIRVASERDRINVARVYRAGQEHIFKWWDELTEEQRRGLLEQVASIDFRLLGELTRKMSATRKLS